MQHLVVTIVGLQTRHGEHEGDMTQVGTCNNLQLPAHEHTAQMGVQFCRHLQDVSRGPRIHAERGLKDNAHLAQIAFEAVRLVGVGHKAQLEFDPFVGLWLGTVHQVI